MIVHGEREWKTLEQTLMRGGKKIVAVYRDGKQYYPQIRFVAGVNLGGLYLFTENFGWLDSWCETVWTKDNDAPAFAALFESCTQMTPDPWLGPGWRTAISMFPNSTGIVLVSTKPEYVQYSGVSRYGNNSGISNIPNYEATETSQGYSNYVPDRELDSGADPVEFGGRTWYVSRRAAFFLGTILDDLGSEYPRIRTARGKAAEMTILPGRLSENPALYPCEDRNCTIPGLALLSLLDAGEIDSFLTAVEQWEEEREVDP